VIRTVEFRIADTFTDSLARLTGDQEKLVKTTTFWMRDAKGKVRVELAAADSIGRAPTTIRDRPPGAEEQGPAVSELLGEHEVVVLTRDLPDEAVRAGDVGVIMLTHQGRAGVPPGYTVEVTTVTGETIAVVDVPADAVRPAAGQDIRHARTAVTSS
jgi:hypothetical protein